jgi:ADP-ribose pyrophosphatase
MPFNEKTRSIENIYNGRILNLEVHTVALDNGNLSKREIVRHRGGVCVAAVTDNGEIVLVRLFRKAYEKELLEVPAGKLEEEEVPELAAARELKEETGLSAKELVLLTTMYPSPGYTDEKIYIYKASGLTEGETNFDEDEFIKIERYPMSKALELVNNGYINDAKSIIAILMLDKK